MNKFAQVVVEDSTSESVQEANIDSEKLYLQKKKEDEIRMQLDEFAKELAQARNLRKNH